LAVLIALRVVVGLGLGAELPVASTYVSELAPARIRGRVIVVLEAFWAVGWTAAALIGYFVIPAAADGWRWAFALGAIPAFYALIVRWGLPESPRWLARRGRLAEADQVVARFEANALAHPPVTPPPSPPRRLGRSLSAKKPRCRRPLGDSPGSGRGVPRAHGGALGRLVLRQLRVLRRVHLDPSILFAQGYDLVKSFGFTLVITLAQLPGYAVAAWLIEVWGRRDAVGVPRGAAVSAVLFGTAAGRASSRPGWRCRSSTSARGAHSTP
jgi:putative MFS transporter